MSFLYNKNVWDIYKLNTGLRKIIWADIIYTNMLNIVTCNSKFKNI